MYPTVQEVGGMALPVIDAVLTESRTFVQASDRLAVPNGPFDRWFQVLEPMPTATHTPPAPAATSIRPAQKMVSQANPWPRDTV